MRDSRSGSAGRTLWPHGGSACAAVVFVSLMSARVCPAGQSAAQGALTADVRRSMEMVTGKEILAHAKVLSDPRFRGREASSSGARKAATHIADHFRNASLRPGGSAGSYYQAFKIRVGYQITSRMDVRIGSGSVGDFRLGVDYRSIHLPGGKAEVQARCALAGYGISSPGLKFDEYQGIDAKKAAVIVFSGTPWSATAARWIRRGIGDQRYDTVAYKARNAAAHGGACLLVVEDPAGWRKQLGVVDQLTVPDVDSPVATPIPVIHITRSALAKITDMSLEELRLLALEIGQEMTPQSMPVRGRRLLFQAAISGRARIGRNVVGILPGRDELLRKQAVVLGAHYDHLGEGAEEDIYFGANDNAAGVGALLTIAQAFAALPSRPRRTIVFLAFDAEEIGRRGSKHYVSRPAIPIEHTTLMINFDMIGRNEPNGIYAVGTRSSEELHQIHQRMNRHVGLDLKHPASFRLGRSDHSPFYFAGVPILYLFGGLDPDYNTPRDTWDKLIPGKLAKVGRLAFLTALEVAQREDRLTFKKGSGESANWPF